MPRFRRMNAPGTVQHVISRFVNREFRFDVAGAREEYLARAGALAQRTDWQPLAFALMSSHVHWIMLAGDRPSSAFVKPLHAGFARWINDREGRLGPVFADRHRTLTFDGETAGELFAYVHNNPERAGVAQLALDSLWTSHPFYAGAQHAPPWLDVDLGLHLCGFGASPAGREAFVRFVRSRAGCPRSLGLSGGDLQQRRAQVRNALGAPVEIVSPTMVRSLGALEMRVAPVVPVGLPLRPAWSGTPGAVVAAVASSSGVPAAAIRSRSRVRSLVEARRLALVTWTRCLHRPTVEMARALGLADSSAVELIHRSSDALLQHAAKLASALWDSDSIRSLGCAGSSDETEKPRTVP